MAESNIRNFEFRVLVEQDEQGYFVASVPSIPGCHSQGETYEEALANVKEAVELCLAVATNDPVYRAKINFPHPKEKQNFIGITKIPIHTKSLNA